MPKKTPSKTPAKKPGLKLVVVGKTTEPTVVDWKALQKTAAFLEKAKLADYIDLMNHPWRNIWMNLVAGISRGAGIVIGGSVVGVLLVVILVTVLKVVFEHAGGVPWIGGEVKNAIGWVLEVIREHGGAE